jgi:hypothetical protein
VVRVTRTVASSFSPDGLYRMVASVLIRLANDNALALAHGERQ